MTSNAIKIYCKYVKYEYKFSFLLTAPTARKIATKDEDNNNRNHAMMK